MKKEIKQYTVSLLFNGDGSKILLLTKDGTIFAGMLNGIGGKVESGEGPKFAAIREIQEKTTLAEADIENFMWLGNLTIPESCDSNHNNDCVTELVFCAGKVTDEHKARRSPNATEDVNWYYLGGDNMPVTDLKLAGNGDLPYFISQARRFLFGSDIK